MSELRSSAKRRGPSCGRSLPCSRARGVASAVQRAVFFDGAAAGACQRENVESNRALRPKSPALSPAVSPANHRGFPANHRLARRAMCEPFFERSRDVSRANGEKRGAAQVVPRGTFPGHAAGDLLDFAADPCRIPTPAAVSRANGEKRGAAQVVPRGTFPGHAAGDLLDFAADPCRIPTPRSPAVAAALRRCHGSGGGRRPIIEPLGPVRPR
jgi:hypothetical protein